MKTGTDSALSERSARSVIACVADSTLFHDANCMPVVAEPKMTGLSPSGAQRGPWCEPLVRWKPKQ